ncbi:hypothetical protein GCM10018780_03320 [Streptomyces lanatus]|nr:hypothetical protein GCM10018780_03320 [Streptomyces lanatus]
MQDGCAFPRAGEGPLVGGRGHCVQRFERVLCAAVGDGGYDFLGCGVAHLEGATAGGGLPVVGEEAAGDGFEECRLP